MVALSASITTNAFRAVGEHLRAAGRRTPIRLVICGGAAGLLAGLLRASRTTDDCDVLWFGEPLDWDALEGAAMRVAVELNLPPAWLNRDATIFAWCLPIGWQSRCEPVGVFGALDVHRLGRLDQIAAKIVSSPSRPQDSEDLRDFQPTEAELAFVGNHLDRLEAEHLDGASFDRQRKVVTALRRRGGVP